MRDDRLRFVDMAESKQKIEKYNSVARKWGI